MEKTTLEQGRKYLGWAWINEYGQIQFTPQQKGTRPGNLKLVMEHADFSLYESKTLFKVTMKFPKKGFVLSQATNKMIFILNQIVAYLK